MKRAKGCCRQYMYIYIQIFVYITICIVIYYPCWGTINLLPLLQPYGFSFTDRPSNRWIPSLPQVHDPRKDWWAGRGRSAPRKWWVCHGFVMGRPPEMMIHQKKLLGTTFWDTPFFSLCNVIEFDGNHQLRLWDFLLKSISIDQSWVVDYIKFH